MIIHVAETGKSFELQDLNPASTIDQLHDVLASLTGIFNQDQLLFAGDARLDPHKSLSFYHLLEDPQPVFLFNRQKLLQNSPPPLPELLPTNVEPVLPELPLASSWSAASGLPSYEMQFRYHFQKGNAVLTASRNKVDACKTLMREMEVQDMALRTVRCSMESHYKSIDHGYVEFIHEYNRQKQEHETILESFGEDVERLRACKLHPGLRTESRYSLLDFVREGSLRKSAEDCGAYHRQLCEKVAALEEDFSDLKEDVEEFLRLMSKVNLEHLRSTMEAYSRLPEEQGGILESLKQDVVKVRKLSEGSQLSSQDAFLVLGAIYDVQVSSHLPRMEECDFKLGKLLFLMVEKKNSMNLCVHQRMQKTAALQASIKLVRNQMTGFKEVMAHQAASFEVLKLPRKVSSSYTACLAEVVRRKAYLKLYFGQVGRLAEKVATEREKEKTRREAFLQQHNALPQDLLSAMGLTDVPSQCLVNVAPFDAALMDIGLSDVEKYAPEYLTGALRIAMDWPETDITGSGDISGADMLEVENTRLKAQLASSLAIICSLDSSFQPESLSVLEDEQQHKAQGGETLTVVERTSEALRLKDEHALQLKKIIEEKQSQCESYEARIRELEERLREQEAESGRFVSAHMEIQAEISGVTEEELMDSNHPEGNPEVLSTADDELRKSGEEDVQRSSTSVQGMVDLLRECQMNSADLEKKLHEAREEARIHLCAADRRAAEYNVLRASSVKLRGLLQRLRNCIASTAGPGASFTDSLRALSASLKSDAKDEVGMEFQSFIKLLSERLMALSQQRAELMERCSASQAFQAQLRKESESKMDMTKSLLAKYKQEKQASKERICLTRFEVHKLAIFFPNSAGHFEAINRGCPNYFLSEESISLFRDSQGGGMPSFVVGQIVHVERYDLRGDVNRLSSSSTLDECGMQRSRNNPFGLALNCEYFVVTVAMVPDLYCF